MILPCCYRLPSRCARAPALALLLLLLLLLMPAAHAELVYVGSQGRQIQALRFDPASGRLELIGPVAGGLRPTWTLAHPQLPILYAVDDDSGKEGTVSAFAVERASGALRKLNEAPTGGNGATHLWLDLPSHTLFAANFGGGSSASIAVLPDGSLGPLVSTLQGHGSGPHRRQASAHAHASAIAPGGHHLLVPDLGADRVFVYGYDAATRVLSPGLAFSAPPGSGPRHLVAGADGRFVYLLNELSADVMALGWDADAGRLSLLQTVAISSDGFAGTKSGAEIARSADGRFLYVANRGEHALLVYGIDAASGQLALLQRIGSGGETPWSFALHASGKWLLVANQRSGGVHVFGVDAASGRLSDTGISVAVATPVNLSFMP